MGHSLIGTRLAHYELTGALGTGAMSEVYLATDTQLAKEVAVKVISENLVQRADLVERFEREARAAARLEHPNLATIYYSGTHEGQRFYAMELVRGWSFGDIIEARVTFNTDQLLSLFAQACVGLGAAQAAGVIHRDIKPGNLMIARDGRLKIVDFGLARLGNDKTLSRAGAMMGTPFYIAPEMVQGRGGDHLSDIYSLGVTMAHALLGVPPYDAETPYGVMMQHVSEPVPLLHELNACVPRPLSELIAVMMAKDPLARPPSYHRVHLALRKIAAGIPRDDLEATIQWCGMDKLNTVAGEGGRCRLCKRTYGLRELPETYHVDLVNWNQSDAREKVAAYIGQAVGQPPEDVALLLDPLPFRAAFRVPRDRAKRMHVNFHDLGAIVELVPADDDTAKTLEIKDLPIAPRWPRSGNESTGDPADSSLNAGSRSYTKLKPIRPPASAKPWQASTAILGAVVLVLLVLVLQKPTLVVLPAPGGESSPGGAPPTTTAVPAPTVGVAPAEAGEPGEGPPAVAVGTPDAGAGPDEGAAPAAGGGTLESPFFLVDPGDVDPAIAAVVVGALDAAALSVTDKLPIDRTSPLPVILGESDLGGAQIPFAPAIRFPTGGVGDDGHPELAGQARLAVARAAVHRAGGPTTPPWLLAGYASWLAHGPLPEAEWPAAVQGAGLPTELDVAPGANPEPVDRVLRGFLSFVVATRSEDRVHEALNLLREGRTIDDASLRALGTTPADLEQEWIGLSGGVD